LDVYESSLAHCVDEVSTNHASAYRHIHLHSFVLHKNNKEPTNSSAYKLLQPHKSQNTSKYCNINTVDWNFCLAQNLNTGHNWHPSFDTNWTLNEK